MSVIVLMDFLRFIGHIQSNTLSEKKMGVEGWPRKYCLMQQLFLVLSMTALGIEPVCP